MATCTPIYLTSLGFNFPRSYVRRVRIMDDGLGGYTWAGHTIIYSWSDYTIYAVMNENVYLWSSNVYSIGHVWDIASCRAVLAGVDQDFALYAWITNIAEEGDLEFRIKVQPSEALNDYLHLPDQPAGYWLPED